MAASGNTLAANTGKSNECSVSGFSSSFGRQWTNYSAANVANTKAILFDLLVVVDSHRQRSCSVCAGEVANADTSAIASQSSHGYDDLMFSW